MSADELIQQFLAVASRASQQGKTVESILGCMEIAKQAMIARTVTLTVEKPSGIIPVTRDQLRNQPPPSMGNG